MVLVLCWHHTGSFLVILHDKVFQVLRLTFSKALKQENVMNLCPLVPKLPNKKKRTRECYESFTQKVCWYKISWSLSSLMSFASLPFDLFLFYSFFKSELLSIFICFLRLNCSSFYSVQFLDLELHTLCSNWVQMQLSLVADYIFNLLPSCSALLVLLAMWSVF